MCKPELAQLGAPSGLLMPKLVSLAPTRDPEYWPPPTNVPVASKSEISQDSSSGGISAPATSINIVNILFEKEKNNL